MIKIENTEISGVIFDMDGLMFDTESVYTLTWPIAAKDFGYDVTEDVVVGAIGLNAEDGCAHFKAAYGQDFPFYEIRVHRLDIAMDYIVKHGLKIKKGLYGLIDYLKAHGIKIAVATSSERTRADAYLKMSNLTDTFDYVVCGDEVTLGKPHPDIFLTAAEKLGVPAENCIILEDSENGIKAAHAAGAFAIMIPDRKQPTEELRKIVYRVYPDLSEVEKMLKNCECN